jgi:hypothetical protein
VAFSLWDINGCNCPAGCFVCGPVFMPAGTLTMAWATTFTGTQSSFLTYNAGTASWLSACVVINGNSYRFKLTCGTTANPVLSLIEYASPANCAAQTPVASTANWSAGFGYTPDPVQLDWANQTLLGVPFFSVTVTSSTVCPVFCKPCGIPSTTTPVVSWSNTAGDSGVLTLVDLGPSGGFTQVWGSACALAPHGGTLAQFGITMSCSPTRSLFQVTAFTGSGCASAVTTHSWDSTGVLTGMTLVSSNCSPLNVVWQTTSLSPVFTFTLTP